MRHLLLAGAGLALLLLSAAPALADTLLEGDGYEIRIPAGFTEAMSMSGTGTMKIKSNMGMLPIDGVPETTVYTAGDMTNPRGSIIVARINLESGSIDNLDDLGLDKMDAMRNQMPEGFQVIRRKVGGYDAVEMQMEMEMLDDVHDIHMVTIAGGDFLMVVMMDVVEDQFPDAAGMWSQMLGSLQLTSGVNKLLLYGGIGLGVVFLLFLLTKLSGSARGYQEVTDWRQAPSMREVVPEGAQAAPAARPLPARTLPAGAPAGLQATRGHGAPAPAPGARGPITPPPAPRAGLVPTLPPSGNWRDRAAG
jgi:hypothetical protein